MENKDITNREVSFCRAKLNGIFVYGNSGAGKDTLVNYLIEETYKKIGFIYLKQRIALTIKQIITEKTGLTTAQLDAFKRNLPAIRVMHHDTGKFMDLNQDFFRKLFESLKNDFDMEYENELKNIAPEEDEILNNLKVVSKIISNFNEVDIVGTTERIKHIINRTNADYVDLPDFIKSKSKNIVIDVRNLEEAEYFLKAGYFGIFLTRQPKEFVNSEHKTDKNIYYNLFNELCMDKNYVPGRDFIVVFNNRTDDELINTFIPNIEKGKKPSNIQSDYFVNYLTKVLDPYWCIGAHNEDIKKLAIHIIENIIIAPEI